MGNTPSTTNWNAKPFLGKLAEKDMLVVCRCYACRRVRTYLAADLAQYFHPKALVGELWSRCPACGAGSSNWRERYRHPTTDDVISGTVIRKLKGFKQSAVWADERYEAPATPEPDEKPKTWEGLL